MRKHHPLSGAHFGDPCRVACQGGRPAPSFISFFEAADGDSPQLLGASPRAVCVPMINRPATETTVVKLDVPSHFDIFDAVWLSDVIT